MSSVPEGPPIPHGKAPVRLRGATATVVFVLMLFAFVIESELTQYVQTTSGYRQPFFLFYIVHSSFSIVFPLHLIFLISTTSITASAYLSGLSTAFKLHFARSRNRVFAVSTARDLEAAFPTTELIRLIAWLTCGISLPALLWFAAITLASVSDVTALWNSNVFWAYVISVKLHNLPWRSRRLYSVLMASAGAAIVVYGSRNSSPAAEDPDDPPKTSQPTAPLLGNILTLIASIGYACYQVLYKEYVALDNDAEVLAEEEYERLPTSSEDPFTPSSSPLQHINDSKDTVYPPPFGFHPNFLISAIGVCTLCVLWVLLPILHYTNVESFRLPSDLRTIIAIAGVAASGMIFNASFMTLLGVWGPIVTSVGNLLTIVLVLLSDMLIIGVAQSLTVWRLLGSGMIVCSFAILAYDTSDHAH